MKELPMPYDSCASNQKHDFTMCSSCKRNIDLANVTKRTILIDKWKVVKKFQHSKWVETCEGYIDER